MSTMSHFRRLAVSRRPGGIALALSLVAGLALTVPAGSAVAGTPSMTPSVQDHSDASSTSPLTVTELRTDNVVDPLGIDNPTPTMSWQLTADRGAHDQRQSAYRVVVAGSAADARRGTDLVWDSGKTAGAAMSVPYAGPALESSRRYYWAVQVWDADGSPSAWSRPAWWETALLAADDWAGARNITPEVAATSWADFTLDIDVSIDSGAAGLVFRAEDADNYYLWQINTVNEPGKVVLRPHAKVNGSFRNLGDVDISAAYDPAHPEQQHRVTVQADGAELITSIDGTEVDRRTDDSLPAGTIGFRTSTSNGVAERARYDNLEVRDPAGEVLLSDDFATNPDRYFPGTEIVDGQLRPVGDPVLLSNDPSAPLLRNDFRLTKPVASARAYVYGLGFYELRLNGSKVGDHQLSPANSQYAQRSLYDSYDVTDLLAAGDNAAGIWLGNGYRDRFSQYGFRWGGPKSAKLTLRVTYADGTVQTVVTDDGWRWSAGPIVANDLYAGEAYDARLEQTGWDTAGFDDSEWGTVDVVDPPSDALVANVADPVRVVQTIRPVALTEPQPGVFVYDLGQNISGWARLRVDGPAGTTVRMRTAEELGTDGLLDTTTNRNAASTDSYVLAGDGPETYEPRFTYHGFRYLEVTCFPGTPTLDSIDGRVVQADLASTGSFSSSEEMLDQIWHNNRWGIRNNSIWTPTDTPVRDERTPPAMDVQAYADASTREFGMNRFYAKYLGDMPPGVALPTDDVKSQYPDMAGGQVALAWDLYEQYGDRATLAEHYPAMKQFVDTNAADHPDLVWPGDQGFGDWCPPDRSDAANGGLGGPGAGANCTSEVAIVNTALWYDQADSVAKAAAALGYPDDAARYRTMADGVAQAFDEHFANAAGNGYGSGRQTTSVLPLAFGMVPADKVAAVGDELVRRIIEDDDGHLDTGIFGTRYLVDALASIGRLDVAMGILQQTSYPGFGFQIAHGATTSWEQWLYAAGMQTHDHAMFAGINTSFYTVLAGITPAEPGYASIDIRPQLPDGLRHVRASQDTVRGTVSSAWTHTPRSLSLAVEIPVNATGTVHVPLSGGAADDVRAPAGAQYLRTEGGAAVYAVGSGSWRFSVTG